jgi:hypothetical protein
MKPIQRNVLIVAVLILIGGGYVFARQRMNRGMPIQSHHSYSMKPVSNNKLLIPGQPGTYAFTIIDDQGIILKDFATVHEKLMHFIVVRKDLQQFQHIHPDFDQATGTFTQKDMVIPTDGEYRLFADFTPAGSQMGSNGMQLGATEYQDVTVGDMAKYSPQPIGSTEATKTFGEYAVSLTPSTARTGSEVNLAFKLTRNGTPVTDLQDYLGALGHAVILSEGDLQFIHGHPTETDLAKQTGTVDFIVNFPEAKKYKVFTQFQRDGKVFTTDFVIDVQQGSGSATPSNAMDSSGSMHMTH